ncbi:MAG: MarR family winged helix-turn-helix transcriptional regulator [Microbacteriaceae bacterium]
MSERPRFSPTIALLTVSRIAEVRIAALLEPHGLTLRKFAILGHIAATPGLSMSDLARRSAITVQSVHTLIGSLVDAGLVQSKVEGSGHAAQISATAAGVALLDRIAEAVEALDAELFADPQMREVSAALAVLTAARMSRGEPQD